MSESLASILLNSSNLLRIDLDGVNVLAPSLVTALEAVLPEKEVRNRPVPIQYTLVPTTATKVFLVYTVPWLTVKIPSFFLLSIFN